jgi:hypothetical protein
MTVESNNVRTDWLTADGTNRNWSYTGITVFSQGHIKVLVRDSLGVITEHTTDFTLYDLDDSSGYVQFPASGSPVVLGHSVQIVRTVPYEQPIAIGAHGAFNPELHEKAFDLLELQIQQLKEDTDRSWKAPVGVGGLELSIIPENHLWIADEAGNMIDGGIIPSDAVISDILEEATEALAQIEEIYDTIDDIGGLALTNFSSVYSDALNGVSSGTTSSNELIVAFSAALEGTV